MRYHMNGKGESAKCDAPPGKCPLEGEHYESEEEAASELKTVWRDGEFVRHQTFTEVQDVLRNN